MGATADRMYGQRKNKRGSGIGSIQPVDTGNPPAGLEQLYAIGSRFMMFSKNGEGYVACCPVHGDTNPSLSINVGDNGGVVLHCHAGCDTGDILEKVDLKLSNLMPKDDTSSNTHKTTNGKVMDKEKRQAPCKPTNLNTNGKVVGKPNDKVVGEYNYIDENSEVLYQVVRYEPKRFVQRKLRDKGGWDYNVKGVRKVLYNLPQVLQATIVIHVEGEQVANIGNAECEKLGRTDIVFTTTSGGAKNYYPESAHAVEGKYLVTLSDNDDPGLDYISNVLRATSRFAKTIKDVVLPGLDEGEDLKDWLEAGNTFEEFLELMENTPPLSIPVLSAICGINGASTVRGKKSTSDEEDRDATVADLIDSGTKRNWAWQSFISIAELNILASEPGTGKTRLCADLARRIYHGLPWPDGSEPTFPKGSKTLWVAADCQYAELTELSKEFGIPPEVMVLNSNKSNPFGGTMLDSKEDLEKFKERIQRVKPALVFVDTTLKATDRTAHKPEDAKAFFTPIQHIALECGVAIMGVTHLNAEGQPLGRRIEGVGRVVMMLEKPDPIGQPNRRKLYVKKSHSLYPPPLGVTMGDNGNEYDTEPPEAKKSKSSRDTPGLDKAVAWLTEKLEKSSSGLLGVSELRSEAEDDGISSKTIYAAKAKMGIEEFTKPGATKKYWKLPS